MHNTEMWISLLGHQWVLGKAEIINSFLEMLSEVYSQIKIQFFRKFCDDGLLVNQYLNKSEPRIYDHKDLERDSMSLLCLTAHIQMDFAHFLDYGSQFDITCLLSHFVLSSGRFSQVCKFFICNSWLTDFSSSQMIFKAFGQILRPAAVLQPNFTLAVCIIIIPRRWAMC